MTDPVVKTDFRKLVPDLYAPKNRQWQSVDVPAMNFLMVDGQGDPNTSDDYAQAVQALYAASYAIKFFSKKELRQDYVVLPLEGLWHAVDMSAFEAGRKDEYQWTMMIVQPQWLDGDMIAAAIQTVKAKKPAIDVDALRVESYLEGQCLQMLHVGSYDDEAPALAQLHDEVMPELGFDFNGLHHEIYLGDPRKVAPERLRTILRQPVRQK